jgi:hypothetical protein
VQGGTYAIENGLVLPEQLTQDGLVGGILGGMCHEFGHQLGLPDLYDTHFGLPTVGEWDLMDSGNAAFFAFQVAGSDEIEVAYGLLPTGLSALCRTLLGWEEPYEVRAPGDAVTLRPSLTSQGSGPRVARLDVSADEYFLVENRRDLLYEHPDDVSGCPYLNRDADTGVILWTSKDDDAKPPRERRNSGEYDFFISAPTAPEGMLGSCGEVGFGLLVWHVDERVLADGYGANEVNADEDRRSLRLLEASGDYEIGDWRLPTVSFLGDGWNDPFRDGYKTTLDATTRPDNRTNDWAYSGWEITGVQFVAPESHQLIVHVTDGVAGWPRTLRGPGGYAGRRSSRRLRCTRASAPRATRSWFRFGGSDGPTTRPARDAIRRGALRPASLAFQAQLASGDSTGTLAGLDRPPCGCGTRASSPTRCQTRCRLPGGIAGWRGPPVGAARWRLGRAGRNGGRATGVRVDPQGNASAPFTNEAGVDADPVVAPSFNGGPSVALVAARGSHSCRCRRAPPPRRSGRMGWVPPNRC